MSSREDNTANSRAGGPSHPTEASREDWQATVNREIDPGYNPQYATVERDPHQHARTERGTSWVSVIFGWLTSLGASLILTGIVGGLVGAMLGAGQTVRGAATESGTTGLVGLLITLFLAFLIGGYCAGRMASRAGVKHGVLVAALALVVTLILAGVGALLGTSFIESLGGVTLPSLPADAPRQSLGTILTVAGILALLFPFIAGAIGGAWGAKTGRKRP
jgi:hypothetical protein